MNSLINSIALRYKQGIVIEKSTGNIPAKYMRDLLLDISQIGYTFDGEVMRVLRTFTEVEFNEFHTTLIKNLKEMVGDNVTYRPLFKNFPNNIPDDDEYYIKRIVGYIQSLLGVRSENITVLSCGHAIDNQLFNIEEFGACPVCQCQVEELMDVSGNRTKLDEITPLKIIRLLKEDDVLQIFTNLLSSKSSISAEDKDTIVSLVRKDPSMFTFVPPSIPMKENAALISALAVEYKHDPNSGFNDYTHVASELLFDNMKTATDILRLAVQLSDGDVSLATPTRFHLNNKERKVIMWLLNEIKYPEEDMLRYKMRWIRLAEVIHSGKYSKLFPNAYKSIQTLRNDADSIKTFNSKVEKLVSDIKNKNKAAEGKLLELLVQRPGEFARRLDWMMRSFKSQGALFTTFKSIVDKLTTPMLTTLIYHLKDRTKTAEMRYFMPKGNVAKLQVIEDKRDVILSGIVDKFIMQIKSELNARFGKLDKLGSVYINPDLRGYLVPLVQRNASKSLVTVSRGSRIALPENKFIRMFLYWKESDNGRIDVDLSAVAFDANWKYKSHLSWTSLSNIGGKHSGDIRSAPNGAAEFIDFDINKAKKDGIRYAVMNVISFTGQPFNTFECFAGVMGRDEPEKGNHFEAKTVKHKFDLAGDTKYNLPLILDLETNEIIWMDLALSSRANSTVEGQRDHITKMCKAIESMVNNKPNLFDLFVLHAQARGNKLHYERQEGMKYDTEFDVDMATNADDILANWL